MSKDFAFLFMPGDYLRDTQCLSEKVQVAYDRIMCEHMRNICISQAQLNFFTKRLNEDEKQELLLVLSHDESGFFIEWVRESIIKRKAYSESRKKNRESKKKDMSDICKTYDEHMEIEIDNEDEIKKEEIIKRRRTPFKIPTIEEVKTYFSDNGYDADFGETRWHYYNDADWFDAHGNPVMNWKQKMRSVWFKPEYKKNNLVPSFGTPGATIENIR